MLKAEFKKHTFEFKQAGGTSRGVLHTKPSWHIKVWDVQAPQVIGIGECSVIPGLSPDDRVELESVIQDVCNNINYYKENGLDNLSDWPAIQFALEVAFLDLKNGGVKELFPSKFTQGESSIVINGLIWMGDPKFMLEQIKKKLDLGFTCLKMKIGAINFDEELAIISAIRKQFSSDELEIRVDANGAFSPQEGLGKLEQLAQFKLHSIEQPIKAGQWELMADMCRQTPLPIALDEELIGVKKRLDKEELLKLVKPQFIILKPSLIGGLSGADEWIELARKYDIGWWATSALEGNIGLNAIAQWIYTKQSKMPQGLGTGQVFANNISSPLYLNGERLFYDDSKGWMDPFKAGE